MPLTPTTRLGLVTIDPNPTTGDFVDPSVINANMTALDAVIGATPATSAARPATPFNGQLIRESDTRRVLVRNGTSSVWDPVGSAFTCTSSTRPASPFDGEIIRETDTRKVLVYNATQTTWDPVTGTFFGTSGARPSTVAASDGVLFRETDTRRVVIWNNTSGAWETVNGAFTCTSGSRPGVVFDGMLIRETDTRRVYVWNATQSVWELIYNGLVGPPVGTLFARRTTNSSGKQNATLADDTQLQVPVVSGGVYVVDAQIVYTSPQAADLQLAWTQLASSSFEWTPGGIGAGTTGVESTYKVEDRNITQSGQLGGADANFLTARPTGLFLAGSSGTVAFRWAQWTTTASDTILYAGSWIRFMRVA